jgi:oligopeptide/dipeptide ABC transporter ATP-binding protein
MVKTKLLATHFPIQDFFGRELGLVKAVDGVNITITEGSTFGIVGESGCGKTTLARTILGLEKSTSGSTILGSEMSEGTEETNIEELDRAGLRELRRMIGVVFQDPMGALNPRMLVKDLICEPMVIHNQKEGMRERAKELLKMVGLNPDHLYRYPHQFSGGQRQRIVIARALALEPKMLILDEPTSALDVSVQSQILNLLKDLQKKMGLTYVFISHDLSVIRHMCDRVAVMYLGKIVEEATADQLFTNPLHPYTQALVSAIPSLDPKTRRERIVLEGDVPSPADPPSGCHFHPRCPIAEANCSQVYPDLREIKKGSHTACHLVSPEPEKAIIEQSMSQQTSGGRITFRPAHMMSFTDAFTNVLINNYVGFKGRASRSEYWWFFLFSTIVAIITTMIDVAVFGVIFEYGPVYTLAAIALFLPNFCVAVRRLHDLGISGWWLLIALIPLLGGLLLLYWAVSEGEDVANDYGTVPTNTLEG